LHKFDDNIQEAEEEF